MHAGKLRHRLTIQTRTATTDSYGQDIYTWSDLANVWGSIKSNIGGENNTEQLETGGKTVEITIRYRDDITINDRVLSERSGRYFYINDIQDLYERYRELKLTCSEAT